MQSLAGDAVPAARAIQSFALFEKLPPGVVQRLLRGHGARSFERGEIVMAQGARSPELNCVLDGQIKLTVRCGRQKERIIDIVGSGKCFCLASLFLDLPWPVTAIALEPSRILALQRQAVIQAAGSSPPLALRLLGRISWQLYYQIREAELDSASSAAQRVVRWLTSFADGSDAGSVVTLQVSKKTTAASLNMTPETFSRVLQHLRDQGLVDVRRREIVVRDADRLRSAPLSLFGSPKAGGSSMPMEQPAFSEIDALHWLEDVESGDVPHWFSADPGNDA